jgi:hypothetical protein
LACLQGQIFSVYKSIRVLVVAKLMYKGGNGWPIGRQAIAGNGTVNRSIPQ